MKEVNFKIKVPNDNYCFNNKECCYYFDNTGGHGTCDLNIGGTIEYNNGSYLKSKECIELKETD